MDPGCGIDRSCTGRVERGDGEGGGRGMRRSTGLLDRGEKGEREGERKRGGRVLGGKSAAP